MHETLRQLAGERDSSTGAEAVRLLRRTLKTDPAGLMMRLDDVQTRRPAPSRRVPSAAALIRRDRGRR